MTFGKVFKAVQSGQYKSFNKEQRAVAMAAIERKKLVLEQERAALTRKVFNRHLLNSGRVTKYSEQATESPNIKGRPWMQRLLTGNYARGIESVGREHERLDLVVRAFGLASEGRVFPDMKAAA